MEIIGFSAHRFVLPLGLLTSCRASAGRRSRSVCRCSSGFVLPLGFVLPDGFVLLGFVLRAGGLRKAGQFQFGSQDVMTHGIVPVLFYHGPPVLASAHIRPRPPATAVTL